MSVFDFAPRPQPPEPVDHHPGTLERIETYRWRDSNGFALWHPDDNPIPILDTGKRKEKLFGRSDDEVKTDQQSVAQQT